MIWVAEVITSRDFKRPIEHQLTAASCDMLYAVVQCEHSTELYAVDTWYSRVVRPFVYTLLADQTAACIEVYAQHAPRLFVVNGNGGHELLRQCDVAGYLMAAERDQRSVVLTERLPDCADVMSITVLSGVTNNESEKWLRPYVHDSIIPGGLRTTCPAPPSCNMVGGRFQPTSFISDFSRNWLIVISIHVFEIRETWVLIELSFIATMFYHWAL